MRLAAYAGASTVLAAGVIIRAFHQRPNFYSACVYLAQSNACLMILTNLVLLTISGFVLGLQRLLYGPLRPIEVELLYENAWFAITETCLAMTIFREEVGAWFVMMFVSLLVGKVWCWIGQGRVEILQQQPPANPRLFHARISVSLFLSVAYDLYMLYYSVSTVLYQARPNMMVMFAFEFAIQATNSLSTAARYGLTLVEIFIAKRQTQARLIERRAQIREDREDALRQVSQNANSSTDAAGALQNLPNENDVDAMDIDVPGWENKGRWIFYLDLATDFFKLVIYVSFFAILMMFYGLPIHIIRDVFITLRSFLKRIRDFLRYRNATRDMNDRYPDATAEDLGRDNVCIICREEMMPWRAPNDDPPAGEGALRSARRVNTTLDERLRPKKLPCGHILHFACLRSWLERQQVCPTCRRPVLEANQIRVVPASQPAAEAPNGQQPRAGQPDAQPAAGAQNRGGRIINIGPLRIGFGVGHPDLVENIARQMHNQPPAQPQIQQANAAERPRFGFGLNFGRPSTPRTQNNSTNPDPGSIQVQLHQIEQQIMQEINSLRLLSDQLHNVRALQGELARLRIARAFPTTAFQNSNPTVNPTVNPVGTTTRHHQQNTLAFQPQPYNLYGYAPQVPPNNIGSGDPNLPPGMRLPPGWTVMPLRQVSLPLSGGQPGVHPGVQPGAQAGMQAAGYGDHGQWHTAPSPVPRAGSAPVSTQPGHGSHLHPAPTTAFSTFESVPNGSSASHVPASLENSTQSAERLRQDNARAENQGSTVIQSSNTGEANPSIDNIDQPSSEGTGNDNSGTIRASSDEAHPASALGSDSTAEPSSSHREGTELNADDPSGDGASEEARDKSKGKGRAVTVEDFIDDVD